MTYGPGAARQENASLASSLFTLSAIHARTRYRFVNKFSLFSELWSPRVQADLNDYQVKGARIEGEFVGHSHTDTQNDQWI